VAWGGALGLIPSTEREGERERERGGFSFSADITCHPLCASQRRPCPCSPAVAVTMDTGMAQNLQGRLGIEQEPELGPFASFWFCKGLQFCHFSPLTCKMGKSVVTISQGHLPGVSGLTQLEQPAQNLGYCKSSPLKLS
jgi:hypothetical protein